VNPKYILFIFVVVLAQILAACGSATASTPEPTGVLQGYYDALQARDIEKLMSFVADNAVFLDQGLRYSGHAEIRASLQSAIKDYVTVDVSNVSDTNGRLVYDFRVFVSKTPVLSGTGLTIVRDGKIIFDGTEESWAAECERDSTQGFCAE
jgi:hypothetical protein